MRDCGRRGVRTAVVVSSGFGELGPSGRREQDLLVEAVRAYGMRLVGPNCLGLINTDPEVRLNATFAPLRVRPGGLALASQSGALGIAVLRRGTAVGLGLSQFVSIGNKADVSGNDLLHCWEGDRRTEVDRAVPGIVRQPAQVRPGRPPGVGDQADPGDQGRPQPGRPAGRPVAHGGSRLPRT